MAAKKTTKSKKTATKKSGGTRQRIDQDAKVKAIVKIDEVHTRADSDRFKLLKKIAAAGARGIAVSSLGDYGSNLSVLFHQKRIAYVK